MTQLDDELIKEWHSIQVPRDPDALDQALRSAGMCNCVCAVCRVRGVLCAVYMVLCMVGVATMPTKYPYNTVTPLQSLTHPSSPDITLSCVQTGIKSAPRRAPRKLKEIKEKKARKKQAPRVLTNTHMPALFEQAKQQ